MNEILSINVCHSYQDGQRRWFEAIVTVDDWKRLRVDLPLDELRKRGVANTLNSFKKVQQWVESDEGWEYVKDKIKNAGGKSA